MLVDTLTLVSSDSGFRRTTTHPNYDSMLHSAQPPLVATAFQIPPDDFPAAFAVIILIIV